MNLITIPGNDDAIRAVKLIVAKMANAVIEMLRDDGEILAESEGAADDSHLREQWVRSDKERFGRGAVLI